jgi:hypothetical protein
MAKFRKRPVVVDAVRWTGKNREEVSALVDAGTETPIVGGESAGHLGIYTREGFMTVAPGDWIIKGVAGELYPCKPAIFEQTYDLVVGVERWMLDSDER